MTSCVLPSTSSEHVIHLQNLSDHGRVGHSMATGGPRKVWASASGILHSTFASMSCLIPGHNTYICISVLYPCFSRVIYICGIPGGLPCGLLLALPPGFPIVHTLPGMTTLVSPSSRVSSVTESGQPYCSTRDSQH